MKGKIEAAANIIVILVAVVVGSVFLKDRFFSTPSEPNEVKAGWSTNQFVDLQGQVVFAGSGTFTGTRLKMEPLMP